MRLVLRGRARGGGVRRRPRLARGRVQHRDDRLRRALTRSGRTGADPGPDYPLVGNYGGSRPRLRARDARPGRYESDRSRVQGLVSRATRPTYKPPHRDAVARAVARGLRGAGESKGSTRGPWTAPPARRAGTNARWPAQPRGRRGARPAGRGERRDEGCLAPRRAARNAALFPAGRSGCCSSTPGREDNMVARCSARQRRSSGPYHADLGLLSREADGIRPSGNGPGDPRLRDVELAQTRDL